MRKAKQWVCSVKLWVWGQGLIREVFSVTEGNRKENKRPVYFHILVSKRIDLSGPVALILKSAQGTQNSNYPASSPVLAIPPPSHPVKESPLQLWWLEFLYIPCKGCFLKVVSNLLSESSPVSYITWVFNHWQIGPLKEGHVFCVSQPHLLLTGLAGFARLCPGDQYEVSNMLVDMLALRDWRTGVVYSFALCCCCCCCLYYFGTRNWTQGLVLAKQVLYHWTASLINVLLFE